MASMVALRRELGRGPWARAVACSLLAVAGVLGAGAPASASQPRMTAPLVTDPGVRDISTKPASLQEVAFDQRLGESVPGDIRLRDEAGREIEFRELQRGRPLLLALVYYECPMLCTMVLNGTVSALKPVEFSAGREFDVVVVSFDGREGHELAAAKKAAYLERYDRLGTEEGWHFLTGDQAQIDRLTAAVGFRYDFDEASGQFAHPSGVVLLTPQGQIARYLFGIDYAPRDVRLGLVEAAQGKIGGLADQVLLYCYKYDPARGRYGAAVMNLVRAGALLTIAALGLFIFMARRLERRPNPDLAAPKKGGS